MEEQGRRLRKSLSSMFYEVYQKVFLRTMKEGQLTPILEMFLYFGFMDVSMVGEEHADELYDLTEKISACRSEQVYTMYDWLKSIYEGENEPSRNEFDLDYAGYLAEQRRMGKLKDSQVEVLKQDNWAKTVFEMENMFVSTNRATYGRVTSFCPVLSRKDMLQSAEKMLVTAKRVEDAIHYVRKIDYSQRDIDNIIPSEPYCTGNHFPVLSFCQGVPGCVGDQSHVSGDHTAFPYSQ